MYRSHSFPAIPVLEVEIICQLGPPNQTIYGRLNEVEIYGEAEPTLPPISVQNGMLAFYSSQDVERALEYLEYKYEQYTAAFVSQYPGKTTAELEVIEDSTGFDDNRPYIDFENSYGISTLRARVASEEEIWLQNTTGEEDASYPDPDDSYTGDDERTLLNYYGEMKIGSYIYVFNGDGTYYQYYDGGGCETCLTALRSRKSDDPLPQGVKLVSPESPAIIGTCESYIKSKGFIYNSDKTWRMKWKIKASNGPFGGNAHLKAVTRSYKKKSGKWKKRGASISAFAFGPVWDGSCSQSTYIETNFKSKWARKVKAKVYYNSKVKQYEIQGEHYHEKAGTHYRSLH